MVRYSRKVHLPIDVQLILFLTKQQIVLDFHSFLVQFLSKISCQIHVFDFFFFLVQFLSEISYERPERYVEKNKTRGEK